MRGAVLVLLLASTAAAAPPELAVSTTSARLGVPLPVRVETPLEPDLARSTTDTYALSGAKRDGGAWTFDVLPLAVGKVPVRVLWSDGSFSTLELRVAEPDLPADADVADIKTPMRARPALWPWLLAAALAYAAWRWYKNRPVPARAPEPVAPPDDRPAEIAALQALEELARAGLWAEGKYKEFYGRLTDVMRAYLERRLTLPARKLTTAELSRHLREASLDRTAVQALRELFQRADLVKFAKGLPAAGQDAVDLAAARKIVELTAAVDLAALEKKP